MPASPSRQETSSAASETGRTIAYPTEMFWPGEPTTVTVLQETYEVVAECPGRSPSTTLKIVRASPKSGGDAQQIAADQAYKLFIALTLVFSVGLASERP